MNLKNKQLAIHYLQNIINSEYAPKYIDILFHHTTKQSIDLFDFDFYDLSDT